MKAYEIKGNPTINGTINVQGSKNSSINNGLYVILVESIIKLLSINETFTFIFFKIINNS